MEKRSLSPRRRMLEERQYLVRNPVNLVLQLGITLVLVKEYIKTIPHKLGKYFLFPFM